jgi:hypothetical protein
MNDEEDEFIEAIPDFPHFVEEVEVIYSEGDLAAAYKDMVYQLSLNRHTEKGELITYRFLINKFREMWNRWNELYQATAERDGGKYLSKQAKSEKKDFRQFLDESLYEQSFKVNKGTPERNRYLFGHISIKHLKQQLDEWKKTWERD